MFNRQNRHIALFLIVVFLISIFAVGCASNTPTAPVNKPTNPTTTGEPSVNTPTTSATPSPSATAPAVTPPAQPQVTQKEVTVYVTNTGKKYHRAGCRYLSKSQIAINLSNAKAEGYTPCSACNPPT